MGKREEKKKELRSRIISAAKVVFEENGFEATSIEKIAERAGVGLGTAYNYFDSKEELYLLAMAENIVEKFEMPDIESSRVDAVQLTVDIVLKQIRPIGKINKGIMKTAVPILLKSMRKDSAFIKESMKIDFMFMDRIRELFTALKAGKRLDESFKTDVAVDLVFSAVLYQLLYYLYIDEMSFEQMCEKIREDVSFIVSAR